MDSNANILVHIETSFFLSGTLKILRRKFQDKRLKKLRKC